MVQLNRRKKTMRVYLKNEYKYKKQNDNIVINTC